MERISEELEVVELGTVSADTHGNGQMGIDGQGQQLLSGLNDD